MAKKAKKKATKVIKKATKKVAATKVKAKNAKPKKVAVPQVKKTTKPAKKKTASKSTGAKVKASTETLLGKTVKPFSVFNSKGEPLTQETLKGRKAVLYFYPKDDTPGCTLEGQQFSKLASEFQNANTVVFGVSKDSVASHDKFICKYDFKIDLISDEKEQLCSIFDVIKEKNMYGKKFMGIERSTFVLDENLKVIKEVRKVSPDGHAQEILEFVKSL